MTDINLPATQQNQPTGLTLPEDAAFFTPEEVQRLIDWEHHSRLQAMLMLYRPIDDSPEEQRFAGMTNLVVRNIRLIELATQKRPERWAVEFLQDHTFGKPVQRVETKNVHMTYQDLLNKVGEAESRFQEVTVEVQAADAKPSWTNLL